MNEEAHLQNCVYKAGRKPELYQPNASRWVIGRNRVGTWCVFPIMRPERATELFKNLGKNKKDMTGRV